MQNGPDGLDAVWDAFYSEDTEYEDGDDGVELASAVLDTFSIPKGELATLGGKLSHLDIKRMDALQVIKLSLLEASFDQDDEKFYEMTVNGDGEVDFYSVGLASSTLADIYYELQSSVYTYDCSGVLVTGAKPIISMSPPVFKSIWGEGVVPTAYDISPMTSLCASPNYSSHAVLVFRNPHLDSGFDDGIDNLYELTDPYESIIGYAKFIRSADKTKTTNINYSADSAVIPIVLYDDSVDESIGVLQHIDTAAGPANCWTGGYAATGKSDEGIKIKIGDEFRYTDIRDTEVDLYTGVEQVVILGWKIDYFNVTINPEEPTNGILTAENSTCVLNVANSNKELFRLEEGKHYVIVYDDDFAPYVLFSKRSFPGDPTTYGADTTFVYRALTEGAIAPDMPESPGCIIPTEGNVGILVDKIFAYVKLNAPSITVTDTGGEGNAKEIAEALEYSVAALTSYDPPAPMAFNGEVVDLTEGVVDKDPTTQQDFINTPLEDIMDTLSTAGHGMEISLSFLETEEEVRKASAVLYKIMNASDGISTTYMCGPSADPTLGDKGPSGGIINSINYSYSDSSSYTISVNEGDLLVDGLGGGCTLSPTLKTTESVTAKGVILDSAGDGVLFKVKIDGIGDKMAINTAPTLLRVGDIVNCSIHNVPVEV